MSQNRDYQRIYNNISQTKQKSETIAGFKFEIAQSQFYFAHHYSLAFP